MPNRDNAGNGMRTCVAGANEPPLDPNLCCPPTQTAMQNYFRGASYGDLGFDVSPSDAIAPANTQRFENSLLYRKPSRVALECTVARSNLTPLKLREAPPDEMPPWQRGESLNFANIDQVNPETYDFFLHRGNLPIRVGHRPSSTVKNRLVEQAPGFYRTSPSIILPSIRQMSTNQ